MLQPLALTCGQLACPRERLPGEGGGLQKSIDATLPHMQSPVVEPASPWSMGGEWGHRLSNSYCLMLPFNPRGWPGSSGNHFSWHCAVHACMHTYN